MNALTSASAAAIIYGGPGTKVEDRYGREVWVHERSGCLVQNGEDCCGALSSEFEPFTLLHEPKQQVRLSTFGFRDTDVLVSEFESQQKDKSKVPSESPEELFTGIASVIEDIARRIAREEIENSRIDADEHYTETWRIVTR